jgi:hypothetical protein
MAVPDGRQRLRLNKSSATSLPALILCLPPFPILLSEDPVASIQHQLPSRLSRFSCLPRSICTNNLQNLPALYSRKEKRNTPPYSIAREKFIAMQKRNLLLGEKLAKATQTLNEEVSHERDRA